MAIWASQCILAIFFKIFGPKRQKKVKIGPKCAKKAENEKESDIFGLGTPLEVLKSFLTCT